MSNAKGRRLSSRLVILTLRVLLESCTLISFLVMEEGRAIERGNVVLGLKPCI